jgi:hypothetical protein
MTGGGWGYCGRRAGRTPFFGRGFGRGYGRGFGFGAAPPAYRPFAAGSELDQLREEADFLKNELTAVQRRIDALESRSSSE